jgi:hypothetical protein
MIVSRVPAPDPVKTGTSDDQTDTTRRTSSSLCGQVASFGPARPWIVSGGANPRIQSPGWTPAQDTAS